MSQSQVEAGGKTGMSESPIPDPWFHGDERLRHANHVVQDQFNQHLGQLNQSSHIQLAKVRDPCNGDGIPGGALH